MLDIWRAMRDEGRMSLRFRNLCCVLVACLGFLSTSLLGEPGQQVASSFVAAVNRPIGYDYLLYLPEDYSPQGKDWPLLLFLHGAGERGSDLNKVKVHGPPKLIEAGKSFPFIVVSPQCPTGEIWDAEALLRLITSVENQYRVDASRIYVTGLSMGGFGTWSLVGRAPERFAAAAPICGGGNFIELALTSEAKKAALKSLPIWVFHGGADGVVAPEESRRLVQLLGRSSDEIKLTVYPGVGHDSWTATYDNPALYEWFLNRSRD